METKISAESAKSILRIHLAKAFADTVVSLEVVLQDEAPLTENQRIELIAVAMMGYRSTADDAEESVDAQVVMEEMREAVNAPRNEWATRDEIDNERDSRLSGW